jgi:hypothetical protein
VPYAVPAEPAIAWQANDLQAGHYIWKGRNMEAEYAPVPAVIANGEVVVAHGDGSINAFDLETGKQHWRVHTSGRIQCGPTIWRDRAFVNSMDGHLYAFALADGRELWRLRVAPRTGRMMVYGQLGSRWPAIASPMVVGDQVVASAGLIGEIDGVHVVSANAETGEIIWERDEWSSSETRGRLSGLAQFTQMGDELLFRAAQMQPVRLAVANGACAPAMPRTLDELVGDRSRKELFKSVNAYKASSYGVLGHETGALSPNMLCYGGRRLLQDQREKDVRQQKIMVLCRDDTGEGRLPIVRIVGAGGGPVAFVCVFPVWGEEDIVFFGVPGETKRSESIVSIKKQELIEAIRQIAMETEVEDILAMGQTITGRGVSIPEKHLVRELSIADEELRRWQVPLLYDQTVAAAALARRTLVVALQLREKATLVALDRKDGNRLWELKLPARPVYNGIAIAPDGSIVLTLVDGRVVKVGEA